jgi:hypothetical protein
MEITENEDGTIDNTTEVIYYYKKLSFNMKVDKWIEKVTVNGETKSGNDIENNSIVKLEIYRKEIKNTKVKVEYKIRITNTEELEGYVGQVIDKIPSGLIFNAEDNEKYWTLDGDKITADLSDEVIKPGEYKELKVVLTWDQDAENLTVKTNKASIKNVTNAAKYEETTTEDNEAETGLLITVSTGENKEKVIISIQLLSTALMLIGSSIVIMKKK